jgi:phage terminase large subunit
MAGLFDPQRFTIVKGGRGSGKSQSVASYLCLMGAQAPHRILCGREYQTSIRQSVHAILVRTIEAHPALRRNYVWSEHVIKGRNGTEFIFAGLKTNIRSTKSLDDISFVWVEEGEGISKDTMETLVPTIRREGSRIIVTMNPQLKTDYMSQEFLVRQRPDCTVLEVNWQDNPWFPDVLRKEKDYMYATDPDAAAHIWGGQFRRNAHTQVLRNKYCVEEFTVDGTFDGPYFGADWGFSIDPTTLVRLWVKGNVLFLDQEVYKVGCEIDATPALFDKVDGARRGIIRADSARPETIRYMQRHGYPNMRAAIKWPGSVEDGVAYLRSFGKIVIHPRCKYAAQEALLWSYKADKSGEPTIDLLDKHNHIWDAVRYALEPLCKQGNRGMIDYMRQMRKDNDGG